MVATKKWLLTQGLSRHTLDNARKSRKLQLLAAGVYAHDRAQVTWQSIASSLQRIYESPVDVGGMTALQLEGFAHYLSTNRQVIVELYSEAKAPAWLKRLNIGASFRWHNAKTLWRSGSLPPGQFEKAHTWQEHQPPLNISCPEKANLEMLSDVPQRVSFDHADELMQGMTSLSPKKLRPLLMACRSVKVKRLFLWLAERQGYVWFDKLDVREFDLGTGDRVIFRGGKFESKYRITVPGHLHGPK